MPYTVRLISDEKAFQLLKTKWNDLLLNSKLNSPFLRWEWMFSWWKVHGRITPGNRLAIVTLWHGEILEAILPGYIASQKIFNNRADIFYLLGSEYESTDYLELCHNSSLPYPEIIEKFATTLTATYKDLDVLCCTNLLKDTQLAIELPKLAARNDRRVYIKHHRICPYIDITGSWDQYFKSLSKNMRYNLRRRSRKLFNDKEATFHVITQPQESKDAMEDLFSLHSKRFVQRREVSKFNKSLRQDFHREVSQLFAAQDILRIFQIRKDDKTIATLYCFLYGNELFYFQAGMDPEWEKDSVGMVLMGQVIRYAHEKGHSRFDFMRGSEAYKFKWTNQTREMISINIGNSVKGQRIVYLKRLYDSTKESLRIFLPQAFSAPKLLTKS